MSDERKITEVRNYKQFERSKVAIYCRVSTRSQEQLESLANQVSSLTRLVAHRGGWTLVDTFIDFRSGKDVSNRTEFQRMLNDCAAHKIDLIVTKSISRFGRNTLEIISAINKLKELGVNVFFENDHLNTEYGDDMLLVTLLQGFAQEESHARSQNIKWGILRGIETGNGKIFNKKCFGYDQDPDGNLIINETEAQTVRNIFDLYLDGYSVIAIIRELQKQNIKTPTGKDQWSKRTVETILANEKYTGDVMVLKSYIEEYPGKKRKLNTGEKARFVAANAAPVIITKEKFLMVIEEKERRSNIIYSDNLLKRKTTHYSMKKMSDKSKTDQNEGVILL